MLLPSCRGTAAAVAAALLPLGCVAEAAGDTSRSGWRGRWRWRAALPLYVQEAAGSAMPAAPRGVEEGADAALPTRRRVVLLIVRAHGTSYGWSACILWPKLDWCASRSGGVMARLPGPLPRIECQGTCYAI
jgi:hypothetical protein